MGRAQHGHYRLVLGREITVNLRNRLAFSSLRVLINAFVCSMPTVKMILQIKMTDLKADTSIFAVDVSSDEAQVHDAGAISGPLMQHPSTLRVRLSSQGSRDEFFCQPARTR